LIIGLAASIRSFAGAHNMATIWVTGARGFIGRHLCKHLHECGCRVVGVGHGAWPEHDAHQWGVTSWLNGDIHGSNLRSLSEITGHPDFVFHLAGGSSVGAAIANPHEDFFRTVATTAELLDWLRLESPATRLVAISSAAVYGAGQQGLIREEQAHVPFSPYGYHKLVMEQLCRSYAASYGTRVVVGRLFSVYGSHLQKQLLWDLCSKLAMGISVVELGGSGDELRDWTDVRDVVRALDVIKDVASAEVPTFNVGTGRPTSVREIAQRVVDAWGAGSELVFSGRSRPGDPFSLLAESARLNALGFDWKIPVEIGLPNYVDWFRGRMRGAG
jgi:UDP-glucose 4-epimerase